MKGLHVFVLFYVLSVAFIYALNRRFAKPPIVIPGDIYISKAAKKIYIPLGSSLILTIILFLILRRFIK